MRMLMKVTLPHEQFNAALKDGTAAAKMKKILAENKPEAAYFTEFHGKRTGILIVDLADPSRIPALVEPWFLTFGADVEIHPTMTPEDLAKGDLEGVARKWA